MNSIAIITARGGSKRIPDKNIRDFRGKPIIVYSIEAALSCGLFEEVMVSTDSERIAKIALAAGAKVPFFRSAKSSDDFASTEDVLIEVLEVYKKNNVVFDMGCCLYPTAPFVTSQLLTESYAVLNKGFDVVFPVVEFSYPIYRALERLNEETKLIWPEYEDKRSQDIPKAFHDAGQFYWFRSRALLNSRSLMGKNAGSIIIDEMNAQDIDNETDWKLAELKHALLFSNE